MVWIRLDDQIAHHPKFIAAGPVAAWLWVCGNGYCNKYLTDGFIPTSALSTLGGVTNAEKWGARLVEVGLWIAEDGGFRVHDFHDHNPQAKDIKAKRKRDRIRKRKERLAANRRRRSVHADGARTARGQNAVRPPVPDPDPDPDLLNTPLTPLPGGRVTRAERKLAKEVVRQRFGRCPHEPSCSSPAVCLELTAREIHNKAKAS